MFDYFSMKVYLRDKLNVDDEMADLLVHQSVRLIEDYLNYSCEYTDPLRLVEEYPMVVILIATDLNNTMNYKIENGLIQSKTQGSRSVSYNISSLENYKLSNQIKSLLPLPRVRVL